MDDLGRYCARMMGGDTQAAHAAEEAARASGDVDRSAMLRAAVAAVRQGSEPASVPAPNAPAAIEPAATELDADDRSTDPATLPEAIARELEVAARALPLDEREALALRELLGLDYAAFAAATDMPPEAVPILLAQARLDLRTQLRGAGAPQAQCDERERALRTIARRQDGEEVPAADDDWLIEHLGHCRGCRQAHAAMLEASACYRAWTAPDMPADPLAGAASGS